MHFECRIGISGECGKLDAYPLNMLNIFINFLNRGDM